MSARRAQDATTFLLWIFVQTHGPESKGLHLERGAQEAGNASTRPGYPCERNGHDLFFLFEYSVPGIRVLPCNIEGIQPFSKL